MKALAPFFLVAGLGAQDVHVERLASGLELHLERVDCAQEVGLFCFVRSGFASDPVGRTGLAHFIEHLVMCATTPERPGWPAMRWFRERKFANAMTRARYTVYFSIASREKISSDARRFADVLAGKAEITQALVDRERARLLVEIANMTEIRPGAAVQWRARARVLGDAPEARVGIGLRAEIASLDRPLLEQAYLRGHRPENARLVVVGRVDPKKDLAFWRETFAKLQAPPRPDAIAPADPSRAAPSIAPHPRAGAPFGVYAFRAPSFADADFAPFFLGTMWMTRRAQLALRPRGRELEAGLYPALYAVLDEPRVAYFGRRGRDGEADEKKVRGELERFFERSARSAKARILGPMLDRQLRMQALQFLMPHVDTEAMLAELRAEKAKGVAPDAATRARRRILGSVARLAATSQGLCRLGLARGSLHVLGAPKDLAKRILEARAEDVARVVQQRYTKERGRFCAVLPLPQEGGDKTGGKSPGALPTERRKR